MCCVCLTRCRSRVRAPWVTQGLFGGSSYIIPNRNCVILGGTGQVRLRLSCHILWGGPTQLGALQPPEHDKQSKTYQRM